MRYESVDTDRFVNPGWTTFLAIPDNFEFYGLRRVDSNSDYTVEGFLKIY
jgi:hypothetical protein